jgi:hypothetical protein
MPPRSPLCTPGCRTRPCAPVVSCRSYNQHEFGGSFVLVIVAWSLFLCAAAVGLWEAAQGVPEGAIRLVNLGRVQLSGVR